MRTLRVVSLITALLAAAFSGFGQAIPAAAQTSTTNLPPIGLASTETLQVNVVNTAPALPAASASAAPAPCSGSIAFYDASGNIIGSAADFKVGSGQTFSAKLPYASAAASGTARIVVRAAITITLNFIPGPVIVDGLATSGPSLLPACLPASSLETYDTATGVTHAYYTGSVGQLAIPVLRSGQFTAAVPAR